MRSLRARLAEHDGRSASEIESPIFGRDYLLERPLLRAITRRGDRWIAWSSSQSGRPEIYVIGFPKVGQMNQISTAGGRRPRWRRDGRELFYLSADGKLTSVSVRAQGDTLDVGLPAPLFTVPAPASFQYDVAPDGNRFIVNSARQVDSAPLTVVLNWPALLKK